MNRTELIKAVARQSKYSQRQVQEILELTLDTICLSLRYGEDVTLVGFGRFETRDHKEIEKYNPQTKQKMIVPAKRSCGFKPAPGMKAKISE